MMLRLLFGVLGTGLAVLPTGAAESRLVINRSESRLEVSVHATADSFTARLQNFEPVVTLDNHGDIHGAHLTFRFSEIVTGKDKRDAAMHKWQQTAAFPEVVFDLTSVDKKDGALTAVGRLNFHGVSKEVRFPITVTHDGDTYAIDGEAAIDTRDFDLPVIRMVGLFKVDPQVRVRFHLQSARRVDS